MQVVVYGTETCPQCVVVKKFLEANEVKYEYKTVGKDISKEELEKILDRLVRSVPVIVVDEEERTFNELTELF